ncbi:DUF6798 domain-containing protein [Floridanema evergladense]|uniref:DUF6798 domain-containing protein n=1 Tax=Floridaenema evergladense BLCC-F167 TaxID=3153639 RepID=A0ABV4WKG2_9CYAN
MNEDSLSSQEKTPSTVDSSNKLAWEKVLLTDFKIPTYIYFLLLYISSLLVTGYVIYSSNQALQIPLVYQLNDPTLFANDPFGDTLSYYASMLWRIIALLVRFIPLEPLFLILFIAERLLVIYAAYNLAKAFVPNSQLAAVGAMALFALVIEPILGSGTIVTANFEQTGLSIPFFLLATASFYKFQPIRCAIWTAIGFNFNSMYGTYALTYFGAVFLLDSQYLKAWKKWLLAFGLFLILASPAIFLTISAFGRSASDNKLWLIASAVRFPYHLYPLTWDKGVFGRFFTLIILVITLLYQNRNKLPQLFKHSVIWAGVSILWLGYAFVAAYIAKSPSMLVMHPARATDLWYCFAAVALVSVCAANLAETKGWKRRAILAAAFAGTILIWNPIIGPYILAVGIIALILHPVSYYLLCRVSANRIAFLLAIWVLLIGVQNFQTRLAKSNSFIGALISQPAPPMQQVANWANTKTSPDAVFLVDPSWDSFRGLAKRSVFVTWKDGSAILWDRPFVNTWAERLKALGLDITQPGLTEGKSRQKLKVLYQKINDQDVKLLQAHFPINYWIVPQKKASEFPTIFENKSYKILEVK